MRVCAYARVSTEQQGAEGYSLDAQMERIRVECEARGWLLMGREVDVLSTRRKERPALTRLLAALRRSEYDALVVARLDRLSRSVGQFAGLLEQAEREGWQLICLDPAVDTTTPYGRAMAQMSAVFAELERALISQRTKEGLAEARARGTFRPGENAPRMSDEARRRIAELHGEGLSLDRICERLDLEGVASTYGRPWNRNSVHSVTKHLPKPVKV